MDTLPRSSLIYLATPYSHPEAAVREERFKAACTAAAFLINCGYKIFSPIAHTHPIACAGDLPRGWDFWGPYDRLLLAACGGMVVAQIPGWQESKGIAAEIADMRAQGKPIVYMAPADLGLAQPGDIGSGPPCRVCGIKAEIICWVVANPGQAICPGCCAKALHPDGESGHQREYDRGERRFCCRYCGLPEGSSGFDFED